MNDSHGTSDIGPVSGSRSSRANINRRPSIAPLVRDTYAVSWRAGEARGCSN